MVEAVVVARQHVAVATEHEREADQEEADEAEAEDGEVGAHHVSSVLGPAEAGLDQGEAGLHEDHQGGADDDPEQVAGLDGVIGGGADGVEVVGRGLFLGERGAGRGQQRHTGDGSADGESLEVPAHSASIPQSRSTVRIRTILVTGVTQTLPSPILSVLAAVTIVSTTLSVSASAHSDLDLHLGEEVDLVLGTSVRLGVATLTSEALDLVHRQCR